MIQSYARDLMSTKRCVNSVGVKCKPRELQQGKEAWQWCTWGAVLGPWCCRVKALLFVEQLTLASTHQADRSSELVAVRDRAGSPQSRSWLRSVSWQARGRRGRSDPTNHGEGRCVKSALNLNTGVHSCKNIGNVQGPIQNHHGPPSTHPRSRKVKPHWSAGVTDGAHKTHGQAHRSGADTSQQRP